LKQQAKEANDSANKAIKDAEAELKANEKDF
jgi:hypothetical protein